MGWRVAYRERDNHYRLYSTISDEWLTAWGSKQDMLRFIAEEYQVEHKKRLIELALRFPHHWPEKGTMRYIYDETGHDAYGEWLKKLANTDGSSYCEVIEQKYQAVMKELQLTQEKASRDE